MSATAYSGSYLAGLVFQVTTSGMWFSGYWWWVCPTGGATGAQVFALWADAATVVLIPGGTVTSGTLTPGQWNYVPLTTPVNLSNGVPYVAATGYTSHHRTVAYNQSPERA